MNSELNPFQTEGYISKEYFCDREDEVRYIKQKLENGNNLTLISNRRLGKTALIYRIFEEIKGHTGIFVDIFACDNLKTFTEALALAIFKRFPEKRGIGRRFMDLLKGFRPVISYDQLTGMPQITFDYQTPKAYEHTVEGLLRFIDNQETRVYVAIDEFQQVAMFPEKNLEAMLRTVIQSLRNTSFIFSGSKKKMMLEIFNDANRPFFASSQIMGLDEIPFDKYKEFIIKKFAERKRAIDDDAVDFILEWTCRHTYCTQVICNSVFSRGKRHVDIEQVKSACDEQLTIGQTTFMQYRSLLGQVQWKMLIAIAKEGLVSTPQAKDFLLKYKIGAASSARNALTPLLEKEMVCAIETPGKISYRVYNVFLMRWLERTF